MKKTIQTIAMAALCLFWTTSARAQPTALKAGDRIPDINLYNMFGSPKAEQKISDFKGKLTLLYFWSANCRSSTELLTDMARLEQDNAGKLKVISIGKGEHAALKKEGVERGLTKQTFIPEDSLWSAMFPHYLYPEIVWIGPDQTILGITTREDVNPGTISKILNGEPYSFSSPKADLMGFDSRKPLFSPTDGYSMKPLVHSVLSSYGDGLPAGMGIGTTGGQIRIHAINQSRLALYFLALKLPGYAWPLNRIIYQSVDPGKFRIPRSQEDRRERSYCYELILPEFFKDRANAYMLADLERLFGITADVEKREVPAYVLSVIPGRLKLKSADDKSSNNFSKREEDRKFMTNSTLFVLCNYLEGVSGSPVLDETGFSGRADISLSGDPNDILTYNSSLAKYGLTLTKAERSVDILVFSSAPQIVENRSQALNRN